MQRVIKSLECVCAVSTGAMRTISCKLVCANSLIQCSRHIGVTVQL